jgi:hypothetical protein
VEVAELYADGLASDAEREEALAAAAKNQGMVVGATRWAVVRFARTAAVMAVDVAGQTAACPPGEEYEPTRWQAESHAQCDLLRDLYGPLPFRSVMLPPDIKAGNAGHLVKMATAIYEERALPGGTFDNVRLAVLADAVEEAGCQEQELLGHLRSPGPHVRGCWAVDILLARE